jgi:ribonuclease D
VATWLVDDRDGLAGALARIDEPVVGIDVERADGLRYFRRAALIQVGTRDHVALIDPLALAPVPLLGDFLARRTSVLHALDNDLDPLRSAGVEVGAVEDTAVAAAMLGLPTGLGPLLTELLDVTLTGDKERFQRADWERRPLPPDMAEYAADDVFHLATLWRDLEDRLVKAGRQTWYAEERDAMVARAFETSRDWTRTRGAGRLRPEERAVLRALWEERETIGREDDLAPNRVLREAVLVDLAQRPAADAVDLIRRNQRRGRPGQAHARRLHAAQEAGRTLPGEPRDNGGGQWSPRLRRVYDAMRHARAARADELGIDAGVLCPSRSLWPAVFGEPTCPADLCRLAGLRSWQTDVLAESLWEAYVTALEAGDDHDDG